MNSFHSKIFLPNTVCLLAKLLRAKILKTKLLKRSPLRWVFTRSSALSLRHRLIGVPISSLTRADSQRTGFIPSARFVLGAGFVLSSCLSACSLGEQLFRQESENRGVSEAKQDQGFSHENQGISALKSSPEARGSELGSWRLPPLDQLPVVAEISSEVLGLFAPLRPAPGENASGNRDTVLTVMRSGHVLLFHVPSGRMHQLHKLPDNLTQAAFFRDTGLLAVAHHQVVEIVSLSQRQVLFSLDRLKTRMNSMDFHPNGESLLLGASDGRVYRWKYADQEALKGDSEEYKILERYYGHSSVVSAVAAHPFGRIFFSGDWTGKLSAFLLFDRDLFHGEYDKDFFGGRYLSKVTPRANAPRPDTTSIAKILINYEGTELYVALQDGRIELWDVRGFEKRAEGIMHKGLIYDLSLGADGKKLASAGRDGRVVQWSFEPDPDPKLPPKAVIEFEVRAAMVSRLMFMEDGRLIAGNANGQVFEVKKPE